MTEPRLSAEQRRVLRLLSDAGPRGIAETLWAAHELNGEFLIGLVLEGLATIAGETVRAGGSAVEVVLVRITDAGRQALEGADG
jgi:hypothetical protein